MKRSKKELLELVFDKFYDEATAILKEFNPCEHKVDNNIHTCIGKLNPKENGLYWSEIACCCRNCPLWNKELGCTANKPLTCRTWICTVAGLKYPYIKEKLDNIVLRMMPFDFWGCRFTKQESLRRALNRSMYKDNWNLYMLPALKKESII